MNQISVQGGSPEKRGGITVFGREVKIDRKTAAAGFLVLMTILSACAPAVRAATREPQRPAQIDTSTAVNALQAETFPFRPSAPDVKNLVISVAKDGTFQNVSWQEKQGKDGAEYSVHLRGQFFWDNELQTIVAGTQKVNNETGEPVVFSPNDPNPNTKTMKVIQNPTTGRWEPQYVILDENQPMYKFNFGRGQFEKIDLGAK